MAAGLRVRVVNTRDGTVVERSFDRSPVRIGRSSINELSIQAPFVSQFHAVLEFDGTRLTLRDLGSTNGTALRASGRVQPNTPADLTAHNFEFAIVDLWFQLSFVSAVPPSPQAKREGLLLSLSANQVQDFLAVDVRTGGTQPDRTREVMGRLQPKYEEYRAAWAKLHLDLCAVMGTLDPAGRQQLLQNIKVDMTAMQQEGDFRWMLDHFGRPATSADGTPQPAMSTEAVALQAMRDLAACYAPAQRPLERAVDVVGFAQKMQDMLGVFFKCFLALRDGHKQFKTQLDIRKASQTTERLNAARAVETAREPRELAARLLDWSDSSNDGARAIESTFAEVMVHHVAMLNGVMGGVRSLLAKLAPASIESELGNARRKAAGGLQIGPFRYKTLWDLYTEIYGDFAEDEKQAFALIFGADFANAYSAMAGEAVPIEEGPESAPAFSRVMSGGPGQPPSVPPPPAASPSPAQGPPRR